MNNILSINNLSKKYYSKGGEILAIKDITLNIKENDFIAIVGPSGCGKSTLLSILSNIDKPTTGTIEYPNGYKKIGYMLQQDCLFPWLTILDNCLIGLKIQKELTKDKKDKVINMLKKYGLENFIYKYPNSLSGGMKQRVALIRTLATNPDILLLDEVLAVGDAAFQQKCADYFASIKGKQTVILVTHSMENIRKYCNRAILLENGKITLDDIPEKVAKAYENLWD